VSGRDIPDGFVAVARVLGAWGLQGHLKVEPLAPPEIFRKDARVTLAGRAHTVQAYRAAGRHARLKLDGIGNRDDAAAMREQYVLVPEAGLPPPADGEYYRFQLIGMHVVTTSGEEIGEVTDVFATAANDVFVVRGPRGEVLVPAIDDVVQNIDLASGRITIEAIPGLLPD
jgi:16S rRNA processing protein RimM